jgi:tetratricopeptide (TPR) repeat protein
LELRPNFIDAYINIGITRIELNDYEGAISDLSRAVGLGSKTGEAYYYRGNAYSKLNKQSEAKKDWAEASKLGYKETLSESKKGK